MTQVVRRPRPRDSTPTSRPARSPCRGRRVSRGRLVVHGHFYQPSRLDPFTGTVPARSVGRAGPRLDGPGQRRVLPARTPSAATSRHMSWDLGPDARRRGWKAATRSPTAGSSSGDQGVNGLAQPFHHTILPLASAADRRAEIRWGLRDFELRFGRPAAGMWLPETAVDLATLRLLAEPASGTRSSRRGRPTSRTSRRAGRTGSSSAAAAASWSRSTTASCRRRVSFEPRATADADPFALERVEPRLGSGTLPDDEPPLVVIATDGELYGHHRPFRELFLERLVQPRTDGSARGFDVVPLADALTEPAGRPFRSIGIAERTSWSCHHGVQRWATECGCVSDGRWKGPLRAALERLAAGIDVVTDAARGRAPGSPDPWAARDAYVDVVIGVEAERRVRAPLAGRLRAPRPPPRRRATFLALMEAQRWRLAMFASDGWYWDEPVRTGDVRRRCAPRRVPPASIDGLAGRRAGAASRRRPGAASRRRATASTAPRSIGGPWPRSGNPPDDRGDGSVPAARTAGRGHKPTGYSERRGPSSRRGCRRRSLGEDREDQDDEEDQERDHRVHLACYS